MHENRMNGPFPTAHLTLNRIANVLRTVNYVSACSR